MDQAPVGAEAPGAANGQPSLKGAASKGRLLSGEDTSAITLKMNSSCLVIKPHWSLSCILIVIMFIEQLHPSTTLNAANTSPPLMFTMISGSKCHHPILQMRQLRPKDSELLAQGHTSTKWQYGGARHMLSKLSSPASLPREAHQGVPHRSSEKGHDRPTSVGLVLFCFLHTW